MGAGTGGAGGVGAAVGAVAGATPWGAIATGAIGAVGGITKFFEGRKMQREARKAIENFQWKELNNSYENLQVSRLGADLQREEMARTTATTTDALRGGGVRGIMGGLGRVQQQNNAVNRQIGADLDQQQKQIDYATAQDDSQIRAMEENRQANELAGYGQMMNTGMNMKHDAMGNLLNTAGFMAQQGLGGGGMGNGGGNNVPQVGGGAAPTQSFGGMSTIPNAPISTNPQYQMPSLNIQQPIQQPTQTSRYWMPELHK